MSNQEANQNQGQMTLSKSFDGVPLGIEVWEETRTSKFGEAGKYEIRRGDTVIFKTGDAFSTQARTKTNRAVKELQEIQRLKDST